MLTDLRKINAIIKPTGALQPGIPSPSMIPRNWKIKIIVLKDCFYTIPLQESNAFRFAFTIPSINNNNNNNKQCLDITGRYCHKECLIVLHYVNYMSPNHLNLLENNSLMLILSIIWMIFF